MENNKKILVDGETKATEKEEEVIWTVARSWTHLVHKAS